MRALIVAALLASAAAAHDCQSVRSCGGISNKLGVCTGNNNGFASLCGAFSHAREDPDALKMTDNGCFNIRPAFAQIRDTNGTASAEASLSLGNMGSGYGVLSWRCSNSRESSPYCTDADANNGTYVSGEASSSTYMPPHFSKTGAHHNSFYPSATITFLVPRQDFTMYYEGTDKSISAGRGSTLMTMSMTYPTSSISTVSYMASSESLWYLFQISNQGSNPFEVTISDGDRIGVSGISFLEKYSNTDRTYHAATTTEPGYYTYDHTWYTPMMEVIDRYELNEDTWKYEKRQYLGIKVERDMQIVATVPKPAMDSGVAQLASLAAACVAAVVAMMMASA